MTPPAGRTKGEELLASILAGRLPGAVRWHAEAAAKLDAALREHGAAVLEEMATGFLIDSTSIGWAVPADSVVHSTLHAVAATLRQRARALRGGG